MTKYEFRNTEYLKEHGKAPKGTGHWAFEIKGVELPEIASECFIDNGGWIKRTIFWVAGVLTLTEAKKKAAAMLAAANVPAHVIIDVAP